MTLLLVFPHITPSGHYRHYCRAILIAARDRGWIVDIAVGGDSLAFVNEDGLSALVSSTGGHVMTAPLSCLSGPRVTRLLEIQFRRWQFARRVGRVAAAIRNHRYDCVYLDGADSIYLACAFLGCPIATNATGLLFLRLRFHHHLLGYGAAINNPRGRLQGLLLWWLSRNSRIALMSPDDPLCLFHLEQLGELRRRIWYVPDMGATVQSIGREVARRNLGIGALERVVACVGLLDKRKGLVELFNALLESTCPANISVLLVGPPPGGVSVLPGAHLAVKLEAQGRIHHLPGAYGEEQLALALRAADAVWLGYNNHPFTSSVLWEAGHAGLPVLGCESGTIAWEIRKNGLGIALDVTDMKSTAMALNRIVAESAERNVWCRNALLVGERHTASSFGAAMCSAMEITASR
jgi:glycosyltransferase involved in cell wall biosynthesis